MRTIETKVYNYSELSEDAKQKVLEKHYDINVSFQWWEYIYEDAANIGLKLTYFDIGRASYCKGDFMWSAIEVYQNIVNSHGKDCETYKTAERFKEEWQPIFNNYLNEEHEDYESRESEDKLNDLESDFLNELLEDYLTILRQEFEYQCSREAIEETISRNEYEFTEDGEMI